MTKPAAVICSRVGECSNDCVHRKHHIALGNCPNIIRLCKHINKEVICIPYVCVNNSEDDQDRQ